MTTDELIKALMWAAKVTTYCDTHMVNCHECEFHGFCTDPNSDESIGQQSKWFTQAADELACFAKENAELRGAQRWMPVAEQLPEYNEFVLITTDNGSCEPFVGWMRNDKVWFANGFCVVNNVTHWRPLPELPQKG